MFSGSFHDCVWKKFISFFLIELGYRDFCGASPIKKHNKGKKMNKNEMLLIMFVSSAYIYLQRKTANSWKGNSSSKIV